MRVLLKSFGYLLNVVFAADDPTSALVWLAIPWRSLQCCGRKQVHLSQLLQLVAE